MTVHYIDNDLSAIAAKHNCSAHAVAFSKPVCLCLRLSVIIIFVAQVISKLTEAKASHIPYRDSKLTRVLQSSLSGHGRVSVRLPCVDICLHILIWEK